MAVLLHSSVAWYVLVVVSIQPDVEGTSPTCVMTIVPQPSLAVTKAIFGPGTGLLHPATVTFAGQEIIGGVISTLRVIVCEQVAVFPLTSVAM